MIGIKNIYIITIFFTCLLANGLNAQQSNEVSKSEFQKFDEQLDYDKSSNKLRWKKAKRSKAKERKTKQKEENGKSVSVPNLGFLSGLGGIFNLLAYALIAVMIGAIFYIVFSNVQIDESLPDQEFKEIDLEEEHIEDVDVETELEKAYRLENYRMALRMKFLLVLQNMSINNDIDWKFEKTNRDYAAELRGTPLYSGFKTISGIFEWVWYGNHEITKEEFDHYSIAFNQFNQEPV